VGYEVLDSGRAQRTADGAQGAPGPVDVVALDDLPDPGDDAFKPMPRQLPRWLTTRPKQLTAKVAAVLATAAVLGVVGGAWWADHRADVAQLARARSAVNAFSLVVGVDGHDAGTGHVADLTLRVFNLGAQPLTIVPSKSGARLSATSPIVSLITGDGTVRPGRDALVRVQLPLDCNALQSLRVRVPVRSPDGTVHPVDARSNDQGGLDVNPQGVCMQDDYVDPLPVSLTGSLTRPMLELTNTTDRPVTVSLDSGSPLTQESSEFLALTTRPALPTVVPAGATKRLSVRIDVQGCHRDLAALSYGGIGFLSLRVEGAPDGLTQTGIDLSTLVGASLERSCR
jgi:hypothetical protein